MKTSDKHTQRGMTLMEVTMAVAIFATVIGITAQALMTFYVSMDVQEQRIEAAQSSRAVMAALREKRGEFQDNFPTDWLAWITDQNNNGWEDYLKLGGEGVAPELPGNWITVGAYNMDGNQAQAGDLPIQVIVTAGWLDRANRPASVQLVSVMTNQ